MSQNKSLRRILHPKTLIWRVFSTFSGASKIGNSKLGCWSFTMFHITEWAPSTLRIKIPMWKRWNFDALNILLLECTRKQNASDSTGHLMRGKIWMALKRAGSWLINSFGTWIEQSDWKRASLFIYLERKLDEMCVSCLNFREITSVTCGCFGL